MFRCWFGQDLSSLPGFELPGVGTGSVCFIPARSQRDLSHHLADRMTESRRGGWATCGRSASQALAVSSPLESFWSFLEDALSLLADGAP